MLKFFGVCPDFVKVDIKLIMDHGISAIVLLDWSPKLQENFTIYFFSAELTRNDKLHSVRMRLSFLSDQKHQITVRNDGANGETAVCGMNY